MKLCSVFMCFVLFHSGFCKQRETTNHIASNSIEYFEKVTNITIPIMIHFDKDLTQKLLYTYHNNTFSMMKTMSKNLVAKVEELFQRPYLNQTIKLKLLTTKYLKRRVVNDENVSTYLKRYCRWQGQRKKLKKKKYFSVLFTGLNVYSLDKGKKMRSSTGRTFLGGLCSVYHSCSVMEWKGKNIVYLLAHELAHSLRVNHDGQHQGCPDRRYIMTNQYDPRNNPNTWSECSRLDLDTFLKSEKSGCLRTGFEIS